MCAGLSHGVAGHPSEFTIVTRDAGAGGLSLASEGPSKAEIQCVDNKDGTCSVTYLPTSPGEYQIVIKFADKETAQNWYNSDEYQAAVPIREQAMDAVFILAEDPPK